MVRSSRAPALRTSLQSFLTVVDVVEGMLPAGARLRHPGASPNASGRTILDVCIVGLRSLHGTALSRAVCSPTSSRDCRRALGHGMRRPPGRVEGQAHQELARATGKTPAAEVDDKDVSRRPRLGAWHHGPRVQVPAHASPRRSLAHRAPRTLINETLGRDAHASYALAMPSVFERREQRARMHCQR